MNTHPFLSPSPTVKGGKKKHYALSFHNSPKFPTPFRAGVKRKSNTKSSLLFPSPTLKEGKKKTLRFIIPQ